MDGVLQSTHSNRDSQLRICLLLLSVGRIIYNDVILNSETPILSRDSPENDAPPLKIILETSYANENHLYGIILIHLS